MGLLINLTKNLTTNITTSLTGDNEIVPVIPGLFQDALFWGDAAQESLGLINPITDFSDNTNNLTQVTTSAQATNTAAEVGGENALVFGSGDNYDMNATLKTLSSGANTAFAVVKSAGPVGSAQTVFNITNSGSAYRYALVITDTGLAFRCNSTGGSYPITYDNTEYAIIVGTYDGVSGLNISMNNSLSKIGVGGDTTSSIGTVGHRGNGSLPFAGGIAELALYNSQLTYETILTKIQSLSTKYSITLAFSQLQISNQKLWLDAYDTGSITHTLNVVDIWDGKFIGNDAVQGTATGPTTNTSTINSYNVLDFDGIDDYMETPFLLDPSTTDFTAIVVAKFDVNNVTEVVLQQLDGTGGGRAWLSQNANGEIRSLLSLGDTISPGLATTSPTIYIVKLEGTTHSIQMNGGTPATQTITPDSATGGIRIGANKSAVNLLSGQMGEVLVYDKALPSDEQSNLLTTLSTKWDILQVPALLELSANLNVTESAGAVSAWGGLSANAWSADQATTADQPDYNATGFNGTPTIKFNETTDHLIVPNFDMQSIGTGGFAIICTIDRNQSDRGDILTFRSTNSNVDNVGLLLTTNGTSLRFFYRRGSITSLDTGSSRSGITTKGVPAVVSIVRDDLGNLEMFVNGVSDYTTTGFNDDFSLLAGGTDLWVGSHHNNTPVPTSIFNGNISDTVIYNRTLTTDEREAAETLLTTRRAI